MIKNKFDLGKMLVLFALCLLPCFSQTLAPGAPGKDAQWATAGKQAVGTSASLDSKVWFTLAQGVMTEVYYPDVTVANVHILQFVVVNPKTKKVETEQDDAIHQIKVLRPDSLSFRQINTAKSDEWKITKTYATDVDRNSVLINVQFETKNKNLNLYVYYDPSLGNSGMGDTTGQNLLSLANLNTFTPPDSSFFAEDNQSKITSALYIESSLSQITNGFYQTSDGLQELRKNGKIINSYSQAENGNIVQMAKINLSQNFTTILSFGKTDVEAFKNSVTSRKKGFAKIQAEYEEGWADYVAKLPKVEPKYQAQFNMAAMQLKAHEDKTVRGANIASLSVPWGGGANANENNIGGYHLIWSRDLYQVATAFWAIGDKDAAIRALNFLFKVQQKEDGSFPQNSYLDGKPFWGSLQLDEVAFPLIMAHEFGVHERETYENHIKKAADFIARTGPATPQERWEEEAGYSPSTIAAEIAGLVCAAEIAKRNDDTASAKRWLKTADDWQANIENWTVTKTGKYSKEPYYVRITQNGKPDAGEKLELNNGAGIFDECEIVDAGFLELVRLGIKSPDDPIIKNSLKVVDQVIRVKTPNGFGFYRYNHDGYGEMEDGRRWNFDGKYTGKGRLWAMLSGERGQYELAFWSDIESKSGFSLDGMTSKDIAYSYLDTMLGFANEGLMISEQIWDSPNVPKNIDKQFIPELKFGEGTGSATPLAWSMAQFIRLAVNLKAGRNLDTPQVVYARYVLGKKADKKPYLANGKCEFHFGREYNNKEEFVRYVWFSKTSFLLCRSKSTILLMYEGTAKDVEIVGDFTNWKPLGYKLEYLSDSQKLIELEFAPTARVEYKLIVDGKWITDPLNPNKIDNGVGGENSFFTMPDYKPTEWDKEPSKFSIETLSELEIESRKFGKRKVKIYLPSEYYKRGIALKLPVLYLQDGIEYINRAKAINVLENLIAAKKVEPFAIVFIDPQDRMKEYWANDDWADFVALEVVPTFEKKYFSAIKTGRENRALLGASLGGATSIWTGIKHADKFSKIGAQSTSFWIDDERIVKVLEKLDGKTKFKFYIDDGTFEGVADSQKAIQILREKGFEVIYIESETGHNWTAWRDRLADAFIALFGNNLSGK